MTALRSLATRFGVSPAPSRPRSEVTRHICGGTLTFVRDGAGDSYEVQLVLRLRRPEHRRHGDRASHAGAGPHEHEAGAGMTAYEASARMAKAQKIARALLAQCSAAAWLKAGVAEGAEEFWLAAAQVAGTRPPSAETQELVVELIRTAEAMAA